MTEGATAGLETGREMKQDPDWYLGDVWRSLLTKNACAIHTTFKLTDGLRSSEWTTSVHQEAKNGLDVGHPLQVAEMLRELASDLEKNFGKVETRLDDFNEYMAECRASGSK